MSTVRSPAELAQLPNMSVVQFRGPALGNHTRLVWQLDEQWYSPGSTECQPANFFPPEAFPAVVLWKPKHRKGLAQLWSRLHEPLNRHTSAADNSRRQL
ncbi:hypothetical protein [Mycolicibacterium neoaurum]|uniref:hypothetical protein n=1 Tax=Mycolicibacterium neoaurum TaxID=1795 RepID=UPI001F4C688E|nr:hypothetical protein [Mycolicibacterium neoaurum]